MEERRAVADATFAELVDAVRSSLQDASGSRASGVPSPAVPSIASPLARPAPFAGEAERCSGFLLQVSLYMEIQASQFPTERAKVAFVISLLADRALSWAEALWNIRHPRLNELATFLEYIKEVFSQTTSCRLEDLWSQQFKYNFPESCQE
ncbi:LDOC1L-like isoform X1 [Labeo rohita]|uniref:LDOC1L-like isoform X1 n=1 Tax=Labeo rohita TaxID=84645 RepID=A0A498NPD6_LABRO|nr:LDOC1L-like isoform X1 [Labeo rohita]